MNFSHQHHLTLIFHPCIASASSRFCSRKSFLCCSLSCRVRFYPIALGENRMMLNPSESVPTSRLSTYFSQIKIQVLKISICIYIYKFVYAYVNVYIYIYIHIFLYMHIRSCSESSTAAQLHLGGRVTLSSFQARFFTFPFHLFFRLTARHLSLPWIPWMNTMVFSSKIVGD